jgi:LmbE family N-acetylglucosaminyl deacetylase
MTTVTCGEAVILKSSRDENGLGGSRRRNQLLLRAPGKQLPDGPLLLVSPHLDDAALSCAALLSRTDPVDVLTVFAGEPDPPRQGPWDCDCGFASSAESVPVRRAEERSAFAGTPHRLAFMDLVEGQYLDWHHSAGEADAIAAELGRWTAANPGGTVALPAGAGRRLGRVRAGLARRLGRDVGPEPHPDHLFVRDVALRALSAARQGAPLLYEELPYVLAGGAARQARAAAAASGWRAVELVAEVDRDAKAARIGAYASQVPHLTADGRRLDVAANLPSHERYWRLVPR